MKCLICDIEVVNGVCPSCKAGGSASNQGGAAQGCQVCGGQRARARYIKASTSVHSGGWYCYDCYHELQRKRYHDTSKSFSTKAEANYYRALEDHYLRPLFYGDEPNCEVIEQKNVEVGHAMKKDDILQKTVIIDSNSVFLDK